MQLAEEVYHCHGVCVNNIIMTVKSSQALALSQLCILNMSCSTADQTECLLLSVHKSLAK